MSMTVSAVLKAIAPEVEYSTSDALVFPNRYLPLNDAASRHSLSQLRKNRLDFAGLNTLLEFTKSRKEKYAAFSELFSTDKLDILETHCIAGSPMRCSEYEQTGFIGREPYAPPSEDLCARVVATWKAYAAKVNKSELALDIPADTNLCWPVLNAMKGVGNRAMNWAFASIILPVVEGRMSIQELDAKLRGEFGTPYISIGSRQQMSGKALRCFFDNGAPFTTKKLLRRIRAIWKGIKIYSMINRMAAKIIVKAALQHPNHNPTWPHIKKFAADMQRKGWILASVDFEKFDKHHGGRWLYAALSVVSKITGHSYDHLVFEAKQAASFYVLGSAYLYTGEPVLWSGVSFTTAVGLVSVDMHLQNFAAYGFIQGRDYDYLSWGDDCLFAFPSQKKCDEFMQVAKTLGLRIDLEPRIKYLGHILEDGRWYIPDETLVMKRLEPEYRPLTQESKTIGIASQILISRDPEHLHYVFARNWDEEEFGPRFSFANIHEAIAEAVRKVKATDIVPILRTMFSGMDLDDIFAAHGDNFLVAELLEKYTDGDFVYAHNVTDALDEIYKDPDLLKFSDGYKKAAEHGSPEVIHQIAQHWGLRGAPGEPYY